MDHNTSNMREKQYDKENIFAKILNRELPAEFVSETEHSVVIKDKYPDAPIHNLVLCKGEYKDLREFLNLASKQEQLDFLQAIKDELNKFSGGARVQMNIEKAGGQVVFHLHAHVMGYEPK